MRKLFALAGLLAIVVGGIVIATSALSPAEANHVPGATYTGTHQGGGTVELQVTQDGSGISRFRATSIPGEPSCNFGESEVNFQTPLPITDHMFTYSPSSGLSLQGSFPAAGTAEGTLRAKRNAIPPFVPACDSGTLTWSASTSVVVTDTSPPTPTQSPTPTPTATPTGTAEPTPTRRRALA